MRELFNDCMKLHESSVFEGNIEAYRCLQKISHFFKTSDAPLMMLTFHGPGQPGTGNWLLGNDHTISFVELAR